MKTERELIDQILEKIESSKDFNSETDLKILKYLVGAYIENRTVKEIDIAKNIFGRDDSFNPMDDSVVRSHMYSLRKQLKIFNISEGADEPIKLVVPKGHYRVEIIDKAKKDEKKSHLINTALLILPLLLVLSISYTIYLQSENSELNNRLTRFNIEDEFHPIWTDFVESELPTILVLGNYFVLKKKSNNEEKSILIRDTRINSSEDFKKYLKKNPSPDFDLVEAPVSYLGVEAPYVVSHLTREFRGARNQLSFKLASELSWEDIQKNNIVFVGSVKTLGILDYYFNFLRFKYSIFPHNIYYTPNLKDTSEVILLDANHQGKFHDDYTVVAKGPGHHNNTIMLITSFSSFGKTEPIKKLVSRTFQNDLIESELIDKEMPKYFEMLIKVNGIERSGFNLEVMHFHNIDSTKFAVPTNTSETTN
ncbi:MAG: hypothetical protein K9J12_16820 [Melioribacteraceae bacterium]|nr:hypothetical protein [Melioribacteraceae bacterium]MCF8263401.1 hypothetical protein [Melioribacteraceae bacterium]MCF8430399.1 hypothetical protein [Melioribacteraceae bacterium]